MFAASALLAVFVIDSIVFTKAALIRLGRKMQKKILADGTINLWENPPTIFNRRLIIEHS